MTEAEWLASVDTQPMFKVVRRKNTGYKRLMLSKACLAHPIVGPLLNNGQLLLVAEGKAAMAGLMREVFGNPFRPISVDPQWLAWSNQTVLYLAETIYDARAFDRLPILADALEDAGCTDPDILAHCRGPGPHVRGCWVVDLLLGKS